MQKSLLKNFALISFVCVLLAFAGLLGAVVPVYADTDLSVKAEIIKPKTNESYFFFMSPSAIFADGEKISVNHSESVIESFSLSDGSSLPATSIFSKADKIARWENMLITLESGNINWYNNNILSGTINGQFIDFCVFKSTLYLITSSSVYGYNLTQAGIEISPVLEKDLGDGLEGICAGLDGLYITSVSTSNGNKHDISIFTPLDGLYSRNILQLNKVLDMETLPQSNTLVALFRGNLSLFNLVNGKLLLYKSINEYSALDISVNTSFIYALTEENSVVTYTHDLSQKITRIASEESVNGFYSRPNALSTRKGNLYISDYGNNRVIVQSGSEYKKIDYNFSAPSALAVDHIGTLTVAHSVNRLASFDSSLNIIEDNKVEIEGENVSIADIKVTSSGDLYILDSSGALFYSVKGNMNFVKVSSQISHISQAIDRPYIYAIKGDKVIKIQAEIQTELDINAAFADDFCIDNDESVYFLKKGRVFKNTLKDGAYIESGDYNYQTGFSISGGASKLLISSVEIAPANISYGDLIIADTARHCIKKIDKSVFSVAIDTGGTPPVIGGETPDSSSETDRIIRTLTSDCEVYATQGEVTIIATLKKGFKVIVPNFDEASAFSMIVADFLTTDPSKVNTVIVGYVYNEFLSPPLEYTSNHEESCRIWLINVPIFKYPSRHAPMLENFDKIQKGETLKIMDFVFEKDGRNEIYGYVDNYPSPITWYRVQFGESNEYVGYVMKDGVSVRGANPDVSIRPQINAVIISLDKVNDQMPAATYILENGEYFPLNDAPLAVGTKVEVVGAYDTSIEYTKIKYYNGYGTIECYVKTANLLYQGVNVVQVMAIILISITLVLALIIVIRMIILKRRQSFSSKL